MRGDHRSAKREAITKPPDDRYSPIRPMIGNYRTGSLRRNKLYYLKNELFDNPINQN